MTDLPDINVWLALVAERHTHHAAAVRYWREAAADQLVFCRVTVNGFLRLGTDPRVLPDPFSMQEAWTTYQRFLELPIISLLPEPSDVDRHFFSFTTAPTFHHNNWTDAYLAAFAIAGGYRLVSFDSDFRRFPGLDLLHLAALPTS